MRYQTEGSRKPGQDHRHRGALRDAHADAEDGWHGIRILPLLADPDGFGVRFAEIRRVEGPRGKTLHRIRDRHARGGMPWELGRYTDPSYAHLYFQVLVAIGIGVIFGAFLPWLATSMK